MRVISNDEFRSPDFAETWNRVLSRSPVHDLGQTCRWNRRWWDHYGSSAEDGRLLVVVDDPDGKANGLWPMFIARRFSVRIASWIGQSGGFPTDHTAPLVSLKGLDFSLQRLMEFLDANRAAWDVAELAWPQELFPAFARVATVHGMRAGLTWSCGVGETNTAIPLPASFDAYLTSLGSRTRYDVRQMLRNVEKHGVTLNVTRGPAAAGQLPELFRLNAGRWSVFKEEKARRFVTETVASMPADDDATLVATLRHGDEALASVLGYDNGTTCYLHSAGVARKNTVGISAGLVTYAMLVRDMIDAGRRCLDMGPGLEEYKFRLGAVAAPSLIVRIWHDEGVLDRWRSGRVVHGVWKRAVRFAAGLGARIGALNTHFMACCLVGLHAATVDF